MEKKRRIERYIRHIKALEIAYEKNIILLEKEMDSKEDNDGNKIISLKDGQIKVFSQGQLTAAETANALLDQIGQKEDELEKLKNPDKKAQKKAKNPEDDSHLNRRLR